MRNRQHFALLRELHVLPNLLRTTQIASNRAETVNKNLSKSSSQRYPNSFSQNTKERHAIADFLGSKRG
jgi:hypothetical protein